MIRKEQIDTISDGVKQVLEDNSNDTIVSVFVGKRKVKDVPNFTMFFQSVNKILVKKLSPGSCKIILWLMTLVDYGNYIEMHVETIMEELDLSRSTVSRSIKELIDNHIILKQKSGIDKRLNMYCINPHHSWKGELKDHKKAISKKENKSILNQLEMFNPNSEGNA